MPSPPACSRMLHIRFCHVYIYIYGERHSSSASGRRLSALQLQTLTVPELSKSDDMPSEKFPFLSLRNDPVSLPKSSFLSTSCTVSGDKSATSDSN